MSIAAGLVACDTPEQPNRPDQPPSIVLISLDSLRADRLGAYGAERDTSPAIDQLAAEGALFETTVAPSPWTLASHVTLFTGMPISSHRVSSPDRVLDPARQPIAQQLLEHGYATAAFVSAPFLDRAYGLDHGFETYVNYQGSTHAHSDTDGPAPDQDAHDRSHRDRSAAEVVDGALSWLESHPPGTQPWFLFVHIWDIHYDYDPPPPYDSMFDPDYTGHLDATGLKHNPTINAGMAERDLFHLRALYDGEIRWVDSQLARLLSALREREHREALVVSLVSDHGEEFFEHGNKTHFNTLFDESLRVPWIIRYPGSIAPGVRVGGIAGLEDVAPTLLGLAGVPPIEEASGRDLSSHLRDGTDATRPQLLQFGLQRALRGPDWKVAVRTDTQEALYYDLKADPNEQAPEPAATAAPSRLARLRNRLNKARSFAESLRWESTDDVELDDATHERLRELGYVE